MNTVKKQTTKAKSCIEVNDAASVVLVAGGAGFIGSHLCEALFAKGCLVYCLDNYTTGKKENLKLIKDNQRFHFINHDVNFSLPKDLPKFDYIFHLAGLEAYLKNQELNLETLLVNSEGTKELLNLAAQQKTKFLLGSSLQIYNGVLSNESLAGYFGQTPAATGVFSHCEAKRFAEALVSLYFQTKNLNARIVRLSNVYGPRMPIDSGNFLNRLFLNYQQGQTLLVPGEGLESFNPIYVVDVVEGLIKAMFNQGSEGQIFSLLNNEKVTFLNFAYQLRNLGGKDLDINFVANESVENPLELDSKARQSQQQLGWRPTVSLQDGIKNTLEWLDGNSVTVSNNSKSVTASDDNNDNKPVDEKKSEPIKKKREFKLPQFKLPRLQLPKLKLPKIKFKLSSKLTWILAGALLVGAILSAPLFLIGINAYQGFKDLRKLKTAWQANNIIQLASHGLTARQSLSRAETVLNNFSGITQILGLSAGTRRLEALLEIGQDIAELSQQAGNLFDHAGLLANQSLSATPADYAQMTSLVKTDVYELNRQLNFLQAKVDGFSSLKDTEFLNIGEQVEFLEDLLPDLRQEMTKANEFLKIIPDILAFEGKKTYLVIFQNNAEIRPTGGFIGSYGFLTFEKGRLLDFVVEDIYTADGQLKGHVEPPPVLKKYLGQAGWYLRDANWSPDFPTSAKQLEWFLQKEVGRQVDGVIAFNLNAAQLILEATGPVDLPDYGEQVTADNLFEKAEYYAEIDFFPGSTQKKDFLGSLSNQIFEKIVNNQSEDWIKVLAGLRVGLEQKEIFLNFTDSQAQKIISQLGWSGAVREIGSQASSVNNYLFIVEANLGVNKANYFLKRDINHQTIFLKDLTSRQNLTLNYENRSPSASWPAGDYKTYLRLYVPQDLELNSVTISNPLNHNQQLNQPETEESQENNKKVIGFYFVVPVGEQRQIMVNLTDKKPLSFEKNLAKYNFYLQKQSGINPDEVSVQVEYPTFIRPFKIVPQGTMSASQLNFKTLFDTDKIFTIDFRR